MPHYTLVTRRRSLRLLGKPPGTDISKQNLGIKALRKFFEEERLSELRSLVLAGVDVSSLQRDRQRTPLIAAVIGRHNDIVKFLIRFAAVDVNVKDRNNYTAIAYGSQMNQFDIVEDLVIAGADVNVKDCKGRTPLMVAIDNKQERLTKMLIHAGADVNEKSINGDPPLFMALKNNMSLDVAKSFLDAGADVNVGDSDGITPLILAICNFNIDTTRYFIRSGADVNAKAASDWAALHIVPYFFGLDYLPSLLFIDALVEAGADINTENIFGQTPLLGCLTNPMGESGAKIMIRNAVLASGGTVTKPDELIHFPAHSTFWDKCKAEVDKMKETRLYDGNEMSLFQILLGSDKTVLEDYMREVQSSANDLMACYSFINETFPIYGVMMMGRIEKVRRDGNMQQQQDSLTVSLESDRTRVLPADVIPSIIGFLSDDDLDKIRVLV